MYFEALLTVWSGFVSVLVIVLSSSNSNYGEKAEQNIGRRVGIFA